MELPANIEDIIRKNILDKFEEVEKSTGVQVPIEIRDISLKIISQLSPKNEKDIIWLVRKIPRDFKKIISGFQKEADDLDEECKFFIDKLIHELFVVTEGKGINHSLWKYMPFAQSDINLVSHLRKPSKSKKPSIKDMYILHKMYQDIYEITILFLSEFAHIIAQKKKNRDRYSAMFVEEWDKKLKIKQTVHKSTLMTFFKKERNL